MRQVGDTREQILTAAREGLLAVGYAGLSTRRVAEGAAVPLSQLHYHFGGKQQLILSVLAQENERLLERQARMYDQELPLWQRYEQACDFLDEDLASGYVRVLQEMVAGGWSNDGIALAVRAMLQAWFTLLGDVFEQAAARGITLAGLGGRELATLIGMQFMGAESLLLLGFTEDDVPIRAVFARIGNLLRAAEEAS